MDDLMGGSFTITNSGIWGSLSATLIINMPQTAVLRTHGIFDRPVAINGQVGIRPVSKLYQTPIMILAVEMYLLSCVQIMYIAMTKGGRITDGREAVRLISEHSQCSHGTA